MALAEGRSDGLSPLGIQGPPGMGKTHLLNAIAERVTGGHPGADALYVNADGFLAESRAVKGLVGGRSDRDGPRRYQTAHVLLIDDLDRIAGDQRGRECATRVLSARRRAGLPAVFSTALPLKEMAAAWPELAQVCGTGVAVRLGMPDGEALRAALGRWAHDLGEGIGDTSVLVAPLATLSLGSLREYKAMLLRVVAYCVVTDRRLSPHLVEELLGPTAVPTIRTGALRT